MILVDPTGLTLLEGAFIGHEEFGVPEASPADIAVILLEQPAAARSPGIAPAELPERGPLDELTTGHQLRDATFTDVGYGLKEFQFGAGPPQFQDSLMRMLAFSSFDALTTHWLHLSQNPHCGDASACYGVSGGPKFLGGAQSNLIVSLTLTGDVYRRVSGDERYLPAG